MEHVFYIDNKWHSELVSGPGQRLTMLVLVSRHPYPALVKGPRTHR